MATGSKATAQLRLQEAHYKTGQPKLPGTPRCDGCRHQDPRYRHKQHGLYCSLHRAAVLTHGVCDAWGNPKPALAEAAANAAYQHEALRVCLDALVRMVPGYCRAAGVAQCTDGEHDDAIHRAAIALHGPDATAWPKPLVDLVAGRIAG